MKGTRRIACVAAIAAIALLLDAHEGHRGTAVKGIKLERGKLSMQEANKKAIGLTHGRVDFRTMEQTLSISSETTIPWSSRAFASTRLPGSISRIMAKPGTMVKKGELLAEIESVEYEALQLEYRQRIVDAKVAGDNLKRAQEAGPGIVTGLELLQLEAAWEEQKNAVEAARMQLSALGFKDEQPRTRTLAITAPIDGWLLHVDLSLGQWVEPLEHLFEILDVSEIWMAGEVPESLYTKIRTGQKARTSLVAFPGEEFDGTILRVGRSIDPTRHVVPIWISVANAGGRIRPGMFGRVDVVVDRAVDVFAAPEKAIITDGAERYAVVLNKDGTYRKANVIVGRRSAEEVEILEGLYPGDRVVVEGAHELSDLFVQGTFGLSREARKYIDPRVVEVELRPIDRIAEFPAQLRLPPANGAAAASRLEGKVEKILVSIGQSVKAGDPVAEVHSLELERLEVEFIRSSLRLHMLRRQRTALEELEKKNIAPRKELLRIEAEVQSLTNAVLGLRSRLMQIGLSATQIETIETNRALIGTVRVPAPIAGEVTDVHVAVGQVVKPGDHVVEVQNRAKMWVEAYAFERDAARILSEVQGQKIEVRIPAMPARRFSAVVVGTGASLERDRVLKVWAELESSDGIPGMMADVTVPVERGEAAVIAVPKSALFHDSGKTYVFIERKGRWGRVPVTPGRQDATHVEIVRGVFPGDSVATHGLEELNNAYAAVR
jgi:RND family efflux transporter MFP subunit